MTAPATPTPHALFWCDLPGAPALGPVVGQLHSFTDGQTTMVSLSATAAGAPDFKLLVLRQGDQVHAFANRCAHFSVPLAAQAAQLISTPLKSLTCNVHYARYDWATGACEAGECDGEALVVVPIEHNNGDLHIGATATVLPHSEPTRTL